MIFIMLSTITFASCENKSSLPDMSYDSELSLSEQTLSQLGVFEPTEAIEMLNTVETDKSNSTLINFENQVGMWFTYMDYQSILKGKTKKEFTDSISVRFKNAKEMGVNTLYIHARAFNDSYYTSEIFPKAEYNNAEYDPLEIMIQEAHELNLSVHAWVNPLRCQSDEQLKSLDDSYQIKKWYNDKETNGTYIVKINENWFLNPAYSEVRKYISDGVKEIIDNYNVDGIHIDDYFYPTTDEQFDVSAFSDSQESNLDEWRISNINKMVSSIYYTIKSTNTKILFGISPQGNINSNYSSQYADVKKWMSESGYCDYIVPQIYFGFENESSPFKETVQNWQDLNTFKNIKLVIGLCTYKIESEDKWAGSGKNEWIDDKGLVSKQVEYTIENKLSIAIYSYDSTFSDEISEQCKELSKTIRKGYGGGE